MRANFVRVKVDDVAVQGEHEAAVSARIFRWPKLGHVADPPLFPLPEDPPGWLRPGDVRLWMQRSRRSNRNSAESVL